MAIRGVIAATVLILGVYYCVSKSNKQAALQEHLGMTPQAALAQTTQDSGPENPGITWYYHPNSELYFDKNQLTIYLGKRADDVWMKLTMAYTADPYINYTNAYLEVGDKLVEIPFDKDQNKLYEDKYHSELLDLAVWPELESLLLDCAMEDSVTMIFKGDEIKEISVGQKYLKPLGEMLLAYKALRDEVD